MGAPSPAPSHEQIALNRCFAGNAACCVLFLDHTGGELLSAVLPDCHVYKAFNTCGTSVMAAVEEMGYPVQM
jgi:hypothetical protein